MACATLHEADGECPVCSSHLLDRRRDDVKELCADMDQRRRLAREQKLTWIAVASAMLFVVGLWCVPGFWTLRALFFAVPFLLDQIALMALLGFVFLKLYRKWFAARPRFSFGLGDPH